MIKPPTSFSVEKKQLATCTTLPPDTYAEPRSVREASVTSESSVCLSRLIELYAQSDPLLGHI
jgi:hypothetical protein